MVVNIAEENGDTVYADFAAIDSYTLEKHYGDKNTLDKINSYCWDYVVLQEQSQRPVMDSAIFYGKTLKYADALATVIYNNNEETQILLFETWARKYGDSELCSRFKWTCTFEDMQNMLIYRYELLGNAMALPVVPCGKAWFYFAPNSSEHIDLYYPDNKHPNEVGSYLNACIFYTYLTNHSPIGTSYNPAFLTSEELLKIQEVAYKVVLRNVEK